MPFKVLENQDLLEEVDALKTRIAILVTVSKLHIVPNSTYLVLCKLKSRGMYSTSCGVFSPAQLFLNYWGVVVAFIDVTLVFKEGQPPAAHNVILPATRHFELFSFHKSSK